MYVAIIVVSIIIRVRQTASKSCKLTDRRKPLEGMYYVNGIFQWNKGARLGFGDFFCLQYFNATHHVTILINKCKSMDSIWIYDKYLSRSITQLLFTKSYQNRCGLPTIKFVLFIY